MASARVPDPSSEAEARSSGTTASPSRPLPAAASRATGSQPAASAAARRSSPSATNRPRRERSRRRPLSLRTSLSFSLWGLVIVRVVIGNLVVERKKGAVLVRRARRGLVLVLSGGSAGRQRLAGAVGKASEGIGVVDGDVGEDLAIELDSGPLQTVQELRI